MSSEWLWLYYKYSCARTLLDLPMPKYQTFMVFPISHCFLCYTSQLCMKALLKLDSNFWFSSLFGGSECHVWSPCGIKPVTAGRRICGVCGLGLDRLFFLHTMGILE